MATTISVVLGSVDEGKRERLIIALRAAGFAPDLGGDLVADVSCPCLAIWSRADAAGAFTRLAGLTKAASEGRLISVWMEATPLPPRPLIASCRRPVQLARVPRQSGPFRTSR